MYYESERYMGGLSCMDDSFVSEYSCIHSLFYLERIIYMNNLTVDSSPSKLFFINMITKDVTVESCILDLIDNSIDAHKRAGRKQSEINIDFSLTNDFFCIKDNCGGMTKETAENRAFKFGNNEIRTANALGMYGIGMKRSIFKIGEKFDVKSKTKSESFKVYMDITEWLNNIDEWKFHLDECKFDMDPGVEVSINRLTDSFKAYLRWEKNIEILKKKISISYKELLNTELTINVNGEKIIYLNDRLYESDILKTFVKTISLSKASVKIIAGLGDAAPKEAGWNIVCNGRTVIDKDKSELTGWESDYSLEDEDNNIDELLKKGGRTIPAFHNDFARFRGYVYIDATDANELPLNTTKDGIDQQHPIYELIYGEMIDVMKKILPQMRKLQERIRECKKQGKTPPTEDFQSCDLDVLYKESDRKFELKLDDYTPTEKKKSIPMYINESEVGKLKKYFEVDTNKELGIKILKFVTDRIDLDE